jgi:hypothetical protein
MAHRQPDELFLKALRAVGSIYLHLLQKQQTEVEALRLMLIEGDVEEEVVDQEVALRLADPAIQARGREIFENKHFIGLQEAIEQVAYCHDFLERLKQITEPSN